MRTGATMATSAAACYVCGAPAAVDLPPWPPTCRACWDALERDIEEHDRRIEEGSVIVVPPSAWEKTLFFDKLRTWAKRTGATMAESRVSVSGTPPYENIERVVLGQERCYDCGATLIVPAPDDPYWCLCSGCGALWQVRDGSISVKRRAAQRQEGK
jgi:hypothetical protein